MSTELTNQIENTCATYAGGGRCLLDRPCPFFNVDNAGARCLYYENAVLPEDDRLFTKYWARFGLAYWDDGAHAKPCNNCGNNFDASDSPKRQYCDTCRDELAREARNRRTREYRRRLKADA